ncbi:MAG: hypothetical protein AAB460_01440 [Patescibacteria group bacterium]
MTKPQRIFVAVLTLLVGVGLLFVGFTTRNAEKGTTNDSETSGLPEEVSLLTYGEPVSYSASVPAHWKLYKNKELGISFMYPPTMRVEQYVKSHISLVSGAEKTEIACNEERPEVPPWISFSFMNNPENLSLEDLAGALQVFDNPTVVHPVTFAEQRGLLYESRYLDGGIRKNLFIEVFDRAVQVDWWPDINSDEEWKNTIHTVLSSLSFPEVERKSMYELEPMSSDYETDYRLVFYDESGSKRVLLNNVNTLAGVYLQEFYFPVGKEKIYFSSLAYGSDSPWSDLYKYDLSTSTFQRMNISDFIRSERFLSPDKRWIAGYNTRSEKTVGTEESLYVFDLEKDEMEEEVRLEGGNLTFMETCQAEIADVCWGSDLQWLDDNSFEYKVYRADGPTMCKSDSNTHFPLFETRRAVLTP